METVDNNKKNPAYAIVLHIVTKARRSNHGNHPADTRDSAAQLEEAVGLANAISLTVMHAECITVGRITPATLMGQGQVARVAERVTAVGAGLVIINHAVSPVQQRNLEKELNCKVIDRTGLILEIFGERASTREGTLQVELAALTYQRSRLVRSWTHLERQRGGFGFMGGPGERQLEIDRRLINTRIDKIKLELDDVRRTRGLQRTARKKREQPLVALVGYTNAGKSSLFNALTTANVLAKDLLFATLDPVMRLLPLAPGRTVVLSDTVGFISDLPTHLVTAFRATLEEVENADVILHVRDISHEDTDAQKHDVLAVLSDMGINEDDPRIIEVLNKIDLVDEPQSVFIINQTRHRTKNGESVCAVSAIAGTGLDSLRLLIEGKAFEEEVSVNITLPYTDGAALAWLYANAKVVNRTDAPQGIKLQAIISLTNNARFKKLYGHAA